MITPIFIPMRSGSSGPKEPDHKCPKCGHHFDDPEEPDSIGAMIFLGCLILVIVCLAALAIDDMAFHARYRRWIMTEDACDYSYGNWEIVEGNGAYAIRCRKNKESWYLGHNSTGYTVYTADISEPQLFLTECNARGFLKEYVERPFK